MLIYAKKNFFITIILFLITNYTVAQEREFTIQGKIIDSENNSPIDASSVILYTAKDSSVLTFTYSSLKGDYKIITKQKDQELVLIARHISYKEVILPISINKSDTVIVKNITMFPRHTEIEEVEIKTFKNPVEIKGDTISFNVSSYNMDSTTVVEDLLKRLPGLILWSDKKITYNGKEIKSVYVDSKPFFFNNKQFAIQNLPNYVVDKVQLYNNKENENNDLVMDIKLKEDKKKGLFGKISLGGGKEKYNLEGSLAGYNKKYRLAITSNKNNLNKINENLQDKLIASSYVGNSSLSSSSNDKMPGVFIVQSNNIEFASNQKFNYILNYDLNKTRNKILQETDLEGILFNTNNINDRVQNILSHSIKQKIDGNISKNIIIKGKLDFNRENSESVQNFLQQNSIEDRKYSSEGKIDVDGRKSNINTNLNINKRFYKSRLRKTLLNINYSFKYNDIINELNVFNKSYISLINSGIDSLEYQRQENSKNKQNEHKVNFKFENIGSVFLNPTYLKISLENTIERYNYHMKKDVVNYENLSQEILTYNPYLSYDTKHNQIIYKPQFTLEKTFEKSSANRYRKYIELYSSIIGSFSHSTNISTNDVHNFTFAYQKITPNININIGKEIVKKYKSLISTSFSSNVIEPTFNQIASISDSSEFFFRYVANYNLKPVVELDVNSEYSYENLKNIGNIYKLKIGYSKINNNIIDSIYYENDVTLIKYINYGGTDNFYINFDITNVYQIDNKPFKYTLSGKYNYGTSYRFVQEILNETKNRSYRIKGAGIYQVNNLFDLDISLQYQDINMQAKNISYSNRILDTKFGLNYYLNSRTTTMVNISNITTNTLKKNILICNLDLSYKAFKNKRSEFKISIFDLFNNNINLVNSQSDMGVLRTSSNNLKRYFLFSYSYFLRRF